MGTGYFNFFQSSAAAGRAESPARIRLTRAMPSTLAPHGRHTRTQLLGLGRGFPLPRRRKTARTLVADAGAARIGRSPAAPIAFARDGPAARDEALSPVCHARLLFNRAGPAHPPHLWTRVSRPRARLPR